jgi:hypothetical protein
MRLSRLFVLAAALGLPWPALALGECGLSCCLASAGANTLSLAEHVGLSVKHEYSWMQTLREGSTAVSAEELLKKKWKMGSSASIPLWMSMEKTTLSLLWTAHPRLQVLATLPYVHYEMAMRMKSPMGMLMEHQMDGVWGWGDLTTLALWRAYQDAEIRPTWSVLAGGGVKAATGRWDWESKGRLIHAMMQPGSGSWDSVWLLSLAQRPAEAWVLLAQATYQQTSTGVNAFEFGDQASLELGVRWQALSLLNLGLGFTALATEPDQDHGGRYRKPGSTADDTANTGLRAFSVAPELQAKLPGTGGHAGFKATLPLWQDVNGVQQVLDWRLEGNLGWAF